jgi:Ras-related protein Rab-1A
VHGVLLVFDLSDEESFKNMQGWLSELNKYAPEKIIKVLAGNKCDLYNVGLLFENNGRGSVDDRREVTFNMA